MKPVAAITETLGNTKWTKRSDSCEVVLNPIRSVSRLMRQISNRMSLVVRGPAKCPMQVNKLAGVSNRVESPKATVDQLRLHQLLSCNDTDSGNAEAFALLHGHRFRFDHTSKHWRMW